MPLASHTWIPFRTMLFLVSALAFILLLTGLILIHELGHFLVARWSKVEVEEFGFGLPPRVKTLFRWQGTQFSLNWIPFGGFVRLKGESALTERERRAKGSFSAAPIPARFAILVAGVLMNFLLAMVLLVFGFTYARWIPTYTSLEDMEAAAARGEIHLRLAPLIDDVVAEGPAATAGMTAGSIILRVDGESVSKPDDVIALQKDKRAVRYIVQDMQTNQEREFAVRLRDGKAGMVLRPIPRELSAGLRPMSQGILLSLRETKVVTEQTIIGMGRLVSSLLQTATVPEGITGIVGIWGLTRASVQEGFLVYLRLVALLSLSLAVLNILPFPALDGGRMVFVLYEAIFRRPVSRAIELGVNSLGFTILIILILFVTFFDVLRIFW